MYVIVQPYNDGADRFAIATVVSEHVSVAEAFAELDRVAERLHWFQIPGDAIELMVVDRQRRPVKRGH